MSRWPHTTLGELLIDATPGFACGENVEDGIFQFRMNNITVDGHLDLSKRRRIPRGYQNMERYFLQPGDVLFNATNSPDLVGKSAYFPGLEEPAVFSNHFLRLRPRDRELDGHFLSRWLNLEFQRGRFKGLCRQWVNQATVGRDALLAMKVPLPPLAEQRRIAEILEKADALRAKRRAALAQLDAITRSIFLDMFGDPIINPRGLPRRKLGTLGSLDRGVSKHRPRNAPELLGGPYPFVQTGDVANSDGYIRNYSSTYSEVGLRQSKMWPAGTLCITIAANIAKTGILTFDACFPDSVVGFRSEEPGMVEFVRAWLSFLQASLEDKAPESAQKNINLKILRELGVPTPDAVNRLEFGSRVAAIESLKDSYQVALAEHDAFFASLQHRAFRGEL